MGRLVSFPQLRATGAGATSCVLPTLTCRPATHNGARQVWCYATHDKLAWINPFERFAAESGTSVARAWEAPALGKLAIRGLSLNVPDIPQFALPNMYPLAHAFGRVASRRAIATHRLGIAAVQGCATIGMHDAVEAAEARRALHSVPDGGERNTSGESEEAVAGYGQSLKVPILDGDLLMSASMVSP